MAYPRSTRGVCLVLTWVLIFGADHVNQADEPQLAPRPGVLVLRGGRVLRGDVIRVGDRYVVAVGDHDELGVPAANVELCCTSLDEAYRLQRDRLQYDLTAAPHLELADWCIRYDMMAAAAEQLMIAQRLEPENPANAQFEKRLQMAARQPAASTAPSPPAESSPTYDQLDQMMQQMPPGTVEQFTNVVQPLLINRCGAGNCHGPNTQLSFRLMYPHSSRTLPRRFTQRNLYAALQFVDQHQPDASPLLEKSALAHGGSARPAFDEREVEQIQHLAEWVHRCATDSRHEPPENLCSPTSILLQPGTQTPLPVPQPPDATAGNQPGNRAGAPDAPGPADRSHVSGHPSTAAPAVAEAIPANSQGSSSDPFDPEIFNRRYLKKSR